jgi:dolichyl-phosphate-mannose--protein O-mannosyl transferase
MLFANPDKDPPEAKRINYRKLNFIEKFIELHIVMLRVNNGLTETVTIIIPQGSFLTAHD